ncbi:MAG: 5-(carboxyamino)imidazole ribonucleotide mutase [Candidatus Hydrogenedentes bacterium]|nr:5-(carboxyamino)imidazole ribonucleotide mutase [Candidatus Hydrogenedentota bacterium]
MTNARPMVAIIMGSKTDWETMRHASEALRAFRIHHECRVLSAHRTPSQLSEFIQEMEQGGCEVFIAGAGGAAHLPGVVASQTLRPVLGVPIDSSSLQGLDALLSIVQMPAGVPVGTLAVGKSGATNAGLMAVAILATSRPDLRDKLRKYREQRAAKILRETLT